MSDVVVWSMLFLLCPAQIDTNVRLLALQLPGGSQRMIAGKGSEKTLSLKARITNPFIERDEATSSNRLSLPVRFTIKNTDTSPILIVRDAVRITRISIARSREDLQAGRYVYDREIHPSFKQAELLGLKRPSQPEVHKILPNESIDREFTWRIALAEKDDRGSSSPQLSLESLRKLGAAWIRFEVSFFPTTMAEEGETFRKAWGNEGSLVLDIFASEPVEVNLPKSI